MFLVIALIAWMVIRSVNDGKTDRELARKGIVSPRLEAKYGSKARERTAGYGLVDYVRDAWSDHWQRRKAVLEADRAAFVPGVRVPLRDRFARATRVVVTQSRRLIDPVEPKPAAAAPGPDPVPLAVETGDVPVGTVRIAEAGRREQWDGAGWKPLPEPTTGTGGGQVAPLPRAVAVEKARRAALDPQEAAAEERSRRGADAARVGQERKRAAQLGIPYDQPTHNPDRPIPTEGPATHEADRVAVRGAVGDGNVRPADSDQADPEWDRLRGETCAAFDREDWPAAVAGLDEMRERFPGGYAQAGLQSRLSNGMVMHRSLDEAHRYARGRAEDADRGSQDAAGTDGAGTTTNEGGGMSAPTGEAVNYETAVAELEAQAAELRQHVDHCTATRDNVVAAKASIDNMQESYRATSQAAALTAEHLAAKNLDGTALANAGTTVDALPAGRVDELFAHLEEVEQVAEERLQAAEAALGAVEANLAHIQATHGDSAVNVAENLSGDASFLDSGGGAAPVPAGGGPMAAPAAGSHEDGYGRYGPGELGTVDRAAAMGVTLGELDSLTERHGADGARERVEAMHARMSGEE